ncbi:hypothetical protein F5X99DRAFT_429521 [Biscogniauxia marginata]|nr:hypothetical protein F5X99DRAFT_429521 [Biscogniauxia marginata]
MNLDDLISSDIAGKVVAVGPSAGWPNIGDRIVGLANAAFQAYPLDFNTYLNTIEATVPALSGSPRRYYLCLRNKTNAGALTISGVDAEGRAAVFNACLDIMSKFDSAKFVPMAIPAPCNLPDGIGAKSIIGFDPKTG